MSNPLRQWAAATYTGEGPLADARRDAVVESAMLNNTLWTMRKTEPLTKEIVQDAIDQTATLWDSLTKLRDTL